MELGACADCSALVPNIIGPTHEYLGASAGCWQIYGEILAKEYSDPKYMAVHRLTVDTYAVQHPGGQDPRAVQSVNGHLLALYLILERKLDFQFATQALGKIIAKRKGQFLWLEPPAAPYAITVVNVAKAASAEEHKEIVKEWAVSTWTAWRVHHKSLELLARDIL